MEAVAMRGLPVTYVVMVLSVPVFVHVFQMVIIAMATEHVTIVATCQFTRKLHAELLAFQITMLVTLAPHATIVATKPIIYWVQHAEGIAWPTVLYALRGLPVTCVAMAMSVQVFVGHACPTTPYAVSALHATIVATQPTMQMVHSAVVLAGPTVPYAARGLPVTYVAMAVSVQVFVEHVCPITLFAVPALHATIVATQPTMQMAHSAVVLAGPTVPYAVKGLPVTCVAMAVSVLVFVGNACQTTLLAVSALHATIVATRPIIHWVRHAVVLAGLMVAVVLRGLPVTYVAMAMSVLVFVEHVCPTTLFVVPALHATTVATQPTMQMAHSAVVLVMEVEQLAVSEQRAICVVMGIIGIFSHFAINEENYCFVSSKSIQN